MIASLSALPALGVPSGQGRIAFIGDIHGCFDELRDLLDRISPAAVDRVVSLGDIVRKGPAVEKCLELWRDRSYDVVLGNNEERLLRYVEQPVKRLLYLDRADRRVSRRPDLLDYIRHWPVFIDFPDAGALAIHGGVFPATRIDGEEINKRRSDVLRLRHIRRRGGAWVRVPKGGERSNDPFWAEQWQGPRIVVYGHTPFDLPRTHARAIGIDTGCVYGGSLTAAILEKGRWTLLSVPARRVYARA